MPAKLQFVVMSSGEDNRILSQLVDALAPWPVLIHQDASRVRPPLPSVIASQVQWVRPARATGWGDWGFASAILQSITQALRERPFDYLQLLSPSCLPIRPISDLIAHVSQGTQDHHVDAFALDRDRDTRMSFAWRAYAPTASERQKLLSRLRRWYFGHEPELEQQLSMSVMHRRQEAMGVDALRAAAAVAMTRALASNRRWFGPGTTRQTTLRPQDPAMNPPDCAVGSVWFGARRSVCERMVQMAASSDFRARFESLTMVDELLIPTLLMHAGREPGPSNHSVSPFDDEGHPVVMDPTQLKRAQASGRFFARKFRAIPDDACRLTALEWAGCRSEALGSQGEMPLMRETQVNLMH
ncbi:MAG: hypothetical protein ACK44L_08085 [Burkholderiales bacterium]|jgi:hypothetical protein